MRGATARTNYFLRATLLVKLLYQRLVILPILIGTDWMVADLFTKALTAGPFFRFRDYMMNVTHAPAHTIRDQNGDIIGLKGKAARLWSKLVDTVKYE